MNDDNEVVVPPVDNDTIDFNKVAAVEAKLRATELRKNLREELGFILIIAPRVEGSFGSIESNFSPEATITLMHLAANGLKETLQQISA